jgi:hemolysin III
MDRIPMIEANPAIRHPSHHEETVNAATHALGFAAAIVAAVAVTVTALRHGNPWQQWSCGLYAFMLVALYAASTLSHVYREPRLRHFFRAADQAVIFVFIAAAWTPMAVSYMNTPVWWTLHGAMWAVALVGFAAKAIFTHGVHLGGVSLVAYIVLGCMPIVALWPMALTVPTGMLLWFLAGGACFLTGTIFFKFDDRIPYFHAAWHLFVVAGTACHFCAIYFYCTGLPR